MLTGRGGELETIAFGIVRQCSRLRWPLPPMRADLLRRRWLSASRSVGAPGGEGRRCDPAASTVPRTSLGTTLSRHTCTARASLRASISPVAKLPFAAHHSPPYSQHPPLQNTPTPRVTIRASQIAHAARSAVEPTRSTARAADKSPLLCAAHALCGDIPRQQRRCASFAAASLALANSLPSTPNHTAPRAAYSTNKFARRCARHLNHPPTPTHPSPRTNPSFTTLSALRAQIALQHRPIIAPNTLSSPTAHYLTTIPSILLSTLSRHNSSQHHTSHYLHHPPNHLR